MARNQAIRFSDLLDRDRTEQERLEQREGELKKQRKRRGGTLPRDEAAEYKTVKALNRILAAAKAAAAAAAAPAAGGGGGGGGAMALLPIGGGGGGGALIGAGGGAGAVAPPPAAREVADVLFVGVRDLFNESPALLGDPARRLHNFAPNGDLVVKKQVRNNVWANDLDFPTVVKVSLVLGLLAQDPVTGLALEPEDPAKVGPANGGSLIAIRKKDADGKDDPAYTKLKAAFYAALGEAEVAFALAERALVVLDDEGDNAGQAPGSADTAQFARVVRCLQAKGVKANEPQLERKVRECLDAAVPADPDLPFDDTDISIPDLTQITDYKIQEKNVRLMGVMICSAMFEELKVFQVVDKIAEMAQNLTLTVVGGDAAKILYKHWRETSLRMSEPERRSFYALTLGIPGGEIRGAVNREFNDLWIRFVSSVSSLVRQKTVDFVLRQTIPSAIGQQQVRKAARDLAQNLSAHGYGMAFEGALELKAEIKKQIQLLDSKEIKEAFGAHDMWQVIDQVATLELGGARNTARYSTLASCGAIITAWLANNVKRFDRPTTAPIIDVDAVTAPDPPTSRTPTSTPTDYDLVNACELWLADTATSEDRIEQMSQPREAPVMTSKPVAIPSIAREMLEQAGVPNLPGLGLGMGMPRH
jgi:hypothetical protein